MVQRTLKQTKTSTVNRIQNDRDLLRSLRSALKKHLPVVKLADEKVVCRPSQLSMVTARAQSSSKGREQSTGKPSSPDSLGERELPQSSQTFPMWFHRAWTPKSCQKKGSGGSRSPSSQQWVLAARRAKHTLGSNGAGSWEKTILQLWGQLPQRPELKQKGKWLGKMLLILCVARKVCVPWVCDATSSARQALLQKQMQTELSVL